MSGQILPDADPATFKILELAFSETGVSLYPTYSCDSKHVYYRSQKLEGADVKSFEVVKKKTANMQWDAYDKQYRYFRGKREVSETK